MVSDATLRDALSHALDRTDLGIGSKYEGKVRDNYTTTHGRRLIVVTDRISAFDRVLGTIPFKGQVLNRLAAYWFQKTSDVAPNHFVSLPDPNVLECVECEPLLVEMVVRAYVTGSTSTSIWTHYARGERVFCGHALPDGLRKNQKLPVAILTPATKAPKGQHDISGSREEILALGQVTAEDFDAAAEIAMRLFAAGQRMCAEHGLILVDTKYEFGKTKDGTLVVIDEIHTPDSSRFWLADSYEGARPRAARQGLRAPVLHRAGLPRRRRADAAARRHPRRRCQALHRSLRTNHRIGVRPRHRASDLTHHAQPETVVALGISMANARVIVRLKPEVLDPQGDAVRRALERLGFDGVKGVRIGKIIEIEIDAEHVKDAAPKLAKMADELLANPVTEDFEVSIG